MSDLMFFVFVIFKSQPHPLNKNKSTKTKLHIKPPLFYGLLLKLMLCWIFYMLSKVALRRAESIPLQGQCYYPGKIISALYDAIKGQFVSFNCC